MAEAMGRTTVGGYPVNNRTAQMLANAERRLGKTFTVFQGSYSDGSLSGGTHTGGGAVDVWVTGVDPWKVQRVLRDVGFAAWYRYPPAFGYHFHCIAIGDPTLSYAAQDQVNQFLASSPTDGLVSRNADNRYHPDPPVVFSYKAYVRKMNIRDRWKELDRRIRELTKKRDALKDKDKNLHYMKEH